LTNDIFGFLWHKKSKKNTPYQTLEVMYLKCFSLTILEEQKDRLWRWQVLSFIPQKNGQKSVIFSNNYERSLIIIIIVCVKFIRNFFFSLSESFSL